MAKHKDVGNGAARRRMALLLTLALGVGVAAQNPPPHPATAPPQIAPPAPAPVPPPPDDSAEEFGFSEPYFERVGDTESVPFGVVTALAQDAKGWLWIGTQAGLVRYDGYRFRLFQQEAGNPASLAGNYISALWAAPDGRLWIGTNGDGLSVFDPHSERFTNIGAAGRRPDKTAAKTPTNSATNSATNSVANPATNPATETQVDTAAAAPKIAPNIASDIAVKALAGDPTGGVWVGSNGGLDWFPPGAHAPQRFSHDPADPASLVDDRVSSLLVDRQGTLWVGSAGGLQRRPAGGKGFESVAPASLVGKELSTLFEAADGKIWIGTRQHGAAWLAPGKLQPHWLHPDPRRADRLPHAWVRAIAQAQPDRIWLTTHGGGIAIADAADGKVLQLLRHDPSNANSLALDMTGALLTDRSGLLWVGTWGGGLQRHNPSNRSIRLLRHSPARPAGLSYPDIHSLLELPDGTIAAGTASNGIDILHRRRGLVGGHRPQPGKPGALGLGIIGALATTQDGALWAGSWQSGAFRLAPGAAAWQSYSSAQGLPHPSVRTFLVTRDGTLWTGTSGGAARWRPELQRFEAAAQAGGVPMRALVRVLAEDGQGRLWVGSDAGLWLKERGSDVLKPIPHEPQRPDSIDANGIRGLLVDSKGRLWVATDRGLERLANWDGTRASFEHISVLAGHPDRTIGSNMQEDSQGRIWIGGHVLWPDTLRLVQLIKPDGFEIGTSWIGASATTRDGLFLRGGTEGFAVIDPTRFQPWADQPPVQATELTVNGKPVAPGALSPRLTLSPTQRTFSVGFSALDFSAPQKNRYSYRLLGYDADWIETDAEHRSASYGNLWPGEYTLQVRGSNHLGEWSPHQLTVPVTVLPAFWQTAWFAALALLALGSAAFGAYRWRVARFNARALLLERLVEQRTAEILSTRQKLEQHDELAAAHKALESAHAQLENTHRQLQEAQQQMLLQEKMAALGTLTAGVAHEINNPVNFIHLGAQNLKAEMANFESFVNSLIDDDAPPETVQNFAERFARLAGNIQIMLNGSERVKDIVKDLRFFSRDDRAGSRVEKPAAKQTVRLSECLHSTLALARPSWSEKIEFITEIGDDPEYPCWPALLNQVFMNLLVNGCHAIDERLEREKSDADGAAGGGGAEPGRGVAPPRLRLWLRLRREGGMLVASFQDEGDGIPEHIQSRIMDPFFTTRAGGTGTGLGLSISYSIVQRHGGVLDFTSGSGQGSCFSVRLPLAGH